MALQYNPETGMMEETGMSQNVVMGPDGQMMYDDGTPYIDGLTYEQTLQALQLQQAAPATAPQYNPETGMMESVSLDGSAGPVGLTPGADATQTYDDGTPYIPGMTYAQTVEYLNPAPVVSNDPTDFDFTAPGPVTQPPPSATGPTAPNPADFDVNAGTPTAPPPVIPTPVATAPVAPAEPEVVVPAPGGAGGTFPDSGGGTLPDSTGGAGTVGAGGTPPATGPVNTGVPQGGSATTGSQTAPGSTAGDGGNTAPNAGLTGQGQSDFIAPARDPNNPNDQQWMNYNKGSGAFLTPNPTLPTVANSAGKVRRSANTALTPLQAKMGAVGTRPGMFSV